MISAGYEFTCGIKPPGTLWCWGENDRGQAGIGTRLPANAPTQVGSDETWATVTSGFRHACATKTDGSLWCWGDNSDGQLANATGWRFMPVQVP
jgi:alpha-tubulin suppressor-like RCC1 family protein